MKTFPSFDTPVNSLHLQKFITNNNYDRIYGKYSTYESLSQYLPHTSSYEQKQCLLKYMEKSLNKYDSEGLQRLFTREPELMIIKQKRLEKLKCKDEFDLR